MPSSTLPLVGVLKSTLGQLAQDEESDHMDRSDLRFSILRTLAELEIARLNGLISIEAAPSKGSSLGTVL